MVYNLVKIEEELLEILDNEDNKGFTGVYLAKYVARKILENRIDQELNSVPVSVLELQLAGLERK